MQTYTRPPPRKHFRFGDIAMMNAEVRFCQILLASRRVRVPLIQPNVLLRKSYGNTRKLKACALADLKRLEKHLVGNSLVALDVLRELGRQGVTIESVNAVFAGLKAALRSDPIVHQGRSTSGQSDIGHYLQKGNCERDLEKQLNDARGLVPNAVRFGGSCVVVESR
jgi:hypothetical protein